MVIASVGDRLLYGTKDTITTITSRLEVFLLKIREIRIRP
jgi:hypothetical protein